MFYSQSLLSRKGPLGNIWIAAYYFKRLRKNQIAETDISSSIDKIMPEDQFSYRILAQLLLGIVRIFSKKVDYLYHDCNEALTNIRKSFTPGRRTFPKEAVSKQPHNIKVAREILHNQNQNVTASKETTLAVPMEEMCAPIHQVTITVPERFELDLFELEDVDGRDSDTPKHQGQSIFEDELTAERNEAPFLNECHRKEVTHSEFNSACFTPVDDVLPSDMMDIDLNIREFCIPSSLEIRRKSQGDSVQESHKHGLLSARISLDPRLHDEKPEDQVDLLKFQETVSLDFDEEIRTEGPKDQAKPITSHETRVPDYDRDHVHTEGHSDTITQADMCDTSDLQSDAGLASPKFAVSTPAKRERLRMVKKRKNFFDEIIVLSNQTLGQCIQDARSLVCKRRKSPHTLLDTWKDYRIRSLRGNFMDPLIPYAASEPKAQNSFHQRKTERSLKGEVDVQSDIPCKSSDTEFSLHESTSMEIPAPTDNSESPETSKLNDAEVREATSMEISDTGWDSMDLELSQHENGSNDKDDGWSIRTRMVAQNLRSRFVHKDQEQKGTMKLACILQGKTRTSCAMIFYETLVLKSHRCIDVKQDFPYADIILSPTPLLETLFKNQ